MDAFTDFPLDFSRPQVSTLRDLLMRTIFQAREIQQVVLDAGLHPGVIDFSGSAALQWTSVLIEARAAERIPALLDVIRLRQPALSVRIDELVGDVQVLEPRTGMDDLTRSTDSGWRGFGDEKLVVSGLDTLLGVAFLRVGVDRSRSICRVTATFRRTRVHGTAALIGPGLLLTNHHVLYDETDGGRAARDVEAWFDYEDSAAGPMTVSVIPCDPTTLFGDADHDWAVVRTSCAPPEGSLILDLTGATEPHVDDYTFIIQHPDGGPKMIGLSHNLIRHVDDSVIQYWTDTKGGSSGAPVFNTRWQVIGLHHRWVEAPESDGVAYRNQARRIEPIIAGMTALGVVGIGIE